MTILENLFGSTRRIEKIRQEVINQNYNEAIALRDSLIEKLMFLTQQGVESVKASNTGIAVEVVFIGKRGYYNVRIAVPCHTVRLQGKLTNMYMIGAKSFYVDWNYGTCLNAKIKVLTIEEIVTAITERL